MICTDNLLASAKMAKVKQIIDSGNAIDMRLSQEWEADFLTMVRVSRSDGLRRDHDRACANGGHLEKLPPTMSKGRSDAQPARVTN